MTKRLRLVFGVRPTSIREEINSSGSYVELKGESSARYFGEQSFGMWLEAKVFRWRVTRADFVDPALPLKDGEFVSDERPKRFRVTVEEIGDEDEP